MNTYKKLVCGFVFLLFSTILLPLLQTSTVYAYTGDELKAATFTPVFAGGKIVGWTVAVGGQTVTFTDEQPLSDALLETARATGANASQFCANTRTGGTGTKGISYTNDGGAVVSAGGWAVSVDIDFVNASGGCDNFKVTFLINSANPTGNGSTGTSTGSVTPPPGTPPAATAGTQDSSSCIANSHTSLEWVMCPLLTGISKAVDGINKAIEGELKFNVKSYLDDNPSVKNAWTATKNIASALIVVVALIVIISQAAGNGIIDAYTFKKMLPRIVIAVVAIQISWDITRWLIIAANDVGSGVAQLLAAAVGTSGGNLDLGSLLNRLNPAWAAGFQLTIVGLLVALLTFAAAFLPLIAMLAFTLVIAVIVAFASLMFRNVLIIACVIFVPIAIIAWVLPGTERYWKFWKENFIKLLMLFPIMMAIIYSGRIVAYIAGDLGRSGPLDFFLVLIGFFGPYFILPKAFKWGGGAMAAGASFMANNGALKKGREGGMGVLKEWDRLNRGRVSGGYRPDDPDAIRYGGKGPRQFHSRIPILGGKNIIPVRTPIIGSRMGGKGVVPTFEGRAIGRIMSRHVLPTDRGRAKTMTEYKKYKAERDEEQAAYIDGLFELAEKGQQTVGIDKVAWDSSTGKFTPKTYSPGEGGPGAAKAALENAMLSENPRTRKQAWLKFIGTKSFIEMQGDGLELDPSKKYQSEVIEWMKNTYGADLVADRTNASTGKVTVRISELPELESLQTNDTNMWAAVSGSRPDLIPPVLRATYNDETFKTYGITDPAEQNKLRGKRLRPEHRIAASVDDSYVGPENLPNVAQGFIQEVHRTQSTLASNKFADVMYQIAEGGSNNIGQLMKLAGTPNSSLRQDVDRALRRSGTTFQDYLDAAKNDDMSTLRAKRAGTPHIYPLTAPGAGGGPAPTPTPAPGPAGPTPAPPLPGGGGFDGAGATAPTASGTGTGGGGTGTGGEGHIEIPGFAGLSKEEAIDTIATGIFRGQKHASTKPGQATHIPAETIVHTERGGEIRIPHNPGETITPGGIILPTERRTREEEAHSAPPPPPAP